MYSVSQFHFVNTLDKKTITKVHEQWFKSYSKENPHIPFVVKKYMNGVLAHFLIRQDTVIRFIHNQKREVVGWTLLRTVDKELADKMRFAFLIYTFLKEKDEKYFHLIDPLAKQQKVYVVFLSRFFKKTYGKRLIYFPFWWVILRDGGFDKGENNEKESNKEN